MLRVVYRALQNFQLAEEPTLSQEKDIFSVSISKGRAEFPQPEVCQYWQEGKEEDTVRLICWRTGLKTQVSANRQGQQSVTNVLFEINWE